jgi:hypothetical protein
MRKPPASSPKSKIQRRGAVFWGLDVASSLRFVTWSLVLCTTLSLLAQNQTPTTASPSSRYLFVLDTSHAMQLRAAGVQKAITDLLGSAMGGQLRRGDTIGIWTYNEDLYTGRFPLQKWSPETKEEITLNVVTFLKNQRYEKKANLEKVLPTLQKMVQASAFITVVLVSDGDEKIHGTPFDAQVNKYYSLWRNQQRKAQMPLLTLLRARSGELTHFALNTAPWPVEMPPLALEITALIDAEKMASQAPPRTPVPPLIISGKKLREERGEKANMDAATPVAPLPSSDTSANGTVPAMETTNNSGQASLPSGEVTLAASPGLPSTSAESKTDPVVPEPKAAPAEGPNPTDESAPTDPAHTAVATVPSTSRLNVKVMLLGSAILIIAVSIAAILVLRRPRSAAPQISLITRSLEREKKP